LIGLARSAVALVITQALALAAWRWRAAFALVYCCYRTSYTAFKRVDEHSRPAKL